MKNVALTIGVLSVLGLFAFTSTSFACGMGYGPRGSSVQTNLTAEQGKQLNAINEKYFQQFEEIQESLNNKDREYQDARANENTTVETLNRLEKEMAELERQYGKVLDQANAEADVFLPEDYGPSFNCAYSGCGHQYHRGNGSHGRHMGQGYQNGMGGRHMDSCCRQ